MTSQVYIVEYSPANAPAFELLPDGILCSTGMVGGALLLGRGGAARVGVALDRKLSFGRPP